MSTASRTVRMPRTAEWNSVRESLRATFHLGVREVRTSIRTPAYFIPNLFIPIFFYYVMVGSLEEFANRSGVQNWEAFQLPVAIMFAVMSGSAGLNMVADIESGYFDKLLLTPANRLSILLGAMGADFIRIVVQGLLVVAVALITGMDFATGVSGAAVMVLIASVAGIAYSAIGFAIALKTGNAQATQSIWALWVPFMFLTTAFAPLEALSGWLRAAASANPMTYILRGLRELAGHGWDVGEIGVAVITVAALVTVTFTLALRALIGRVR
ncbi:MAG: ABC transporter permease [Actinomycetota bacterium]